MRGKSLRLPAKWLGVLLAAGAGVLLLSGSALAASHAASTPSPAAKTSTHSPSTPANVTTTTSTSNPDLGYAALGFGGAAIMLALVFIRWDRSQTLEVQERLAADGLETQPQNDAVDGGAMGGVAPTGQLIVDGPDRLLVGATADFVARRRDTRGQAVAHWTAAPPGMLRVPAEDTSRVAVTALKAGTVTLTPNDGTGKRLVVTTARRQTPELPFVGDDWGRVVVAIVLATITAALGLAGALSGEAVATLLGALVGYVVARQSGSVAGRSSIRKASAGNADQHED